jgi:hypothetical protein
MMAGVSAITPVRGRVWARVAGGAMALIVVAAGGFTVWYRAVYNVWPGQGASARVHWCGRDYESFGGPPWTWRQISAQERRPVHAVGAYPPLGWPAQELFAAVTPAAPRLAFSPPLPCAMVVYLHTGPGQYQAYSLEGGP